MLHVIGPLQDEFACKQAKKDEFQTGPKFVPYHVNGVLNGFKNDPSYEFIGEVILKINVV
jgi:hypothetical protein